MGGDEDGVAPVEDQPTTLGDRLARLVDRVVEPSSSRQPALEPPAEQRAADDRVSGDLRG